MSTRPHLDFARTENNTATRIGLRLGVEFVAVTAFDAADPKTIADQLRALADRLDPKPAREWPIGGRSYALSEVSDNLTSTARI